MSCAARRALGLLLATLAAAAATPPPAKAAEPLLTAYASGLVQLLQNHDKAFSDITTFTPLPPVVDKCAADLHAIFPQHSNGSLRNLSLDALRLLDSWGKPPSGILAIPPSIQMFGDFDECLVLRIPTIPLHFCMVEGFDTLLPNETMVLDAATTQVASWGVCLPTSCDERSIYTLVVEAAELYIAGAFASVSVHCARREQVTTSSAAALAVVCLLLLLVVLGTGLHLYLDFRRRYRQPQLRDFDATDATGGSEKGPPLPSSPGLVNDDLPYQALRSGGSTRTATAASGVGNWKRPASASGAPRPGSPPLGPETLPAAERAPLLPAGGTHGLQGIEEPLEPLWVRVLLAFSLRSNLPRLLSLSRGRSTIAVFDGMRSLSMLWVILGHSWLWIFKQWPSNMSALIDLGQRLSFQVVAATSYAVDTFFFISGFLVCFSCLNVLARRQRFPWARFYLHRYLRITPAYAFTMLIFVQVRPGGPARCRCRCFPGLLCSVLVHSGGVGGVAAARDVLGCVVQLSPFLGEGPNFYRQQISLPVDSCEGLSRSSCGCERYWWANILYIHNY